MKDNPIFIKKSSKVAKLVHIHIVLCLNSLKLGLISINWRTNCDKNIKKNIELEIW